MKIPEEIKRLSDEELKNKLSWAKRMSQIGSASRQYIYLKVYSECEFELKARGLLTRQV